ncbi:MAG: hypothetical protein FJ090_14875 [Deltaproteobacteria bacterium]|nr:hypothetical protein [Deltaproteobacteria bacterium]
MTTVPGHEQERVLKEKKGYRRVLITRFDGMACVTRVITTGVVPVHHASFVRRLVVEGKGAVTALGDDIGMTLEGYAVAARVLGDPGAPPRWTRAIDGGVTSEGHVYVSTRWVEGEALHELHARPGPDEARDLSRALVDLLVVLHGAGVAYGDLKLANLVRRPDGGLALIDLDTLRHVGGGDNGVPHRDRTVAWAAPEQLERRETWLASDLWAAARCVRALFGDVPPEDWRMALAACRLRDPLSRPTAESLRAVLAGETGQLVDHLSRPIDPARALEESVPAEPLPTGKPGAPDDGTGRDDRTDRVAEATERVPDETERVPEGSASAPSVAPAPPSAASSRSMAPAPAPGGCLAFVLGLGKVALFFAGLATLAMAAGVFAYQQVRRDRADDLAATLVEQLKTHKIDPRQNGESERQRLAVAAQEAYDVAATPRTCALRALTLVWAQKWQMSGKWSPTDFAEARAAVQESLCDGQPEAALAEATLYAGACRRRDPEAPQVDDCQHAVASLAPFWVAVPPGEGWHWLRTEAAWQEVRALSSVAGRYAEIGSAEAAGVADRALARCDEALGAWVAFAPVNGPELLDECMVAAGVGGRVEAYLRYADARLATLPTDTSDRRALLAKAYVFAGLECRDTKLRSSRGNLVATGSPWCVALGHAARRCTAEAAAVMGESALGDNAHPWADLGHALAGRASACLK